jgi:hypothetical protein
VASLDAEMQTLKTEEARLRGDIGALEQRLEAVPYRQSEFTLLSRDHQTTRDQYESLLKRYEEARVAQNMETENQGERFRVLEAAVPPAGPTAPNRPRLLLMSLFLAALIAVLGVLGVEQIDTTFHSVDDVRQFTTLPVLAAIPRLQPAAGPQWAAPGCHHRLDAGRVRARWARCRRTWRATTSRSCACWCGAANRGDEMRAQPIGTHTGAGLVPPGTFAGRAVPEPEAPGGAAAADARSARGGGHQPGHERGQDADVDQPRGRARARTGRQVLLIDADMRRPSVVSQLGLGDDGGPGSRGARRRRGGTLRDRARRGRRARAGRRAGRHGRHDVHELLRSRAVRAAAP